MTLGVETIGHRAHALSDFVGVGVRNGARHLDAGVRHARAHDLLEIFVGKTLQSRNGHRLDFKEAEWDQKVVTLITDQNAPGSNAFWRSLKRDLTPEEQAVFAMELIDQRWPGSGNRQAFRDLWAGLAETYLLTGDLDDVQSLLNNLRRGLNMRQNNDAARELLTEIPEQLFAAK